MLANKALSAAPSAVPVFVEDIFSSYLYTGNGSTQTITNNIDLSTKGGMVWIKKRDSGVDHVLQDTERGTGVRISSNTTTGNTSDSTCITAFNSSGFSLGSTLNSNAATYVSWTFAQQEKFFDVVTYTGNATNRTINHNLGSTPGCYIVKRTDSTSNWFVWHRSLGGNDKYVTLNSTNATSTSTTHWNNTGPTSTTFSIGTDTDVNTNSATYVVYLFAHDAGGFGASGSDNVITCGSYTGTGSAQTISLGYEPQWILIKQTSNATAWNIWDNMRGMLVGGTDPYLQPNSSAAEDGAGAFDFLAPTATGITIDPTSSGYNFVNFNGGTYIYIAIRRGPMKTPTSATSIYNAITYTGNNTSRNVTGFGFPVDLIIGSRRDVANTKKIWSDRLRGKYLAVYSTSTSAEANETQTVTDFALQDGITVGTDNNLNENSIGIVVWGMRRAPGFFDVVCYTGTGSATTVSHNLGVAPEMMIVKRRSTADNWFVYSQTLGNLKQIALDGSGGASGNNNDYWNSTSPTSTVFTVGVDSAVNASSSTYVAYLFASLAGVSKVGSYTGTGTTQTINCGFTAGSRFVLIKRTDSTGDWYVWDSARGIVAGNDPYLLLNTLDAEVTNTDYIDTANSGFEISSTAPAAINANGGSFIFLAIA
jgi:hypothetical protein